MRYKFAIASLVPKRPFLISKPAFCCVAACLMVVLRLVSFDYQYFFTLRSIPDHDMYQGASFFATSMHSMRLNGDIVWWNPISNNGYAQYYQSFFSPLAPTSNHIVFIVWAQGVRLLGVLGIAVPEYFQYLAINYIVFPFLAFLALAAFCMLLFENIAAIFLVLIIYTFSGIGLWNSAWFYFQEPFNLFFLLAAAIAALQRPSLRRLLLLLVAIIVQATSVNYWTIYNFWFVAITLIAYCFVYPNQLSRLCLHIRETLWQYKLYSVILLSVSALVVLLWVALIFSIVDEQSSFYIRAAGEFSIVDAYDRVKELRSFTTELFNPDIYRALESYPSDNPMHSARYIGVFLLPFLAFIPFYQWQRREKFLIVSAIGILCVCIAPPILLALWASVPFMDKIRHLFYFYTQYWQFIVVLLAVLSFDKLITNKHKIQVEKRFAIVIYGFIAVCAMGLLGYGIFSYLFPVNDHSLQSNLYSLLLIGIVSILMLQFLGHKNNQRSKLFTVLLMVLVITDMTRYFWDVSLSDNKFTIQRWSGVQSTLTASIRSALSNPWPAPDLSQGFDAGLFNNMPISNDFWPSNTYMYHRYLNDLSLVPNVFQGQSIGGKSFDFYTSTKTFSTTESIDAVFENNPGELLNNKELVLLVDSKDDLVYSQIAKANNDVQFDITNPELWQISGMSLSSREDKSHNTWLVTENPNMQYKPALDICLADYSYVFVRMAISSNVVSPTVQFYYQLNGDTHMAEERSAALALLADGKQHSYAFAINRLQLDRKAHLTGIRLDPVIEGARSGQSWVQLLDFRLIHGGQPNTCAVQPTPAAAPLNEPSFTYTWNEWRYNTFGIDLEASQAGWLLIRQLYDPLWKLTLDGKPVLPIRANFVDMAIPLPQGKHQLRMDYRPFARNLYWPAGLLLELLLIVLFAIALRKSAAIYR